jgi:Domain of unknown function (DUF4062)
MARLRVFVSSTCYDLGLLRSELRPFITGVGYEPVMSEYSDVLYDPRTHTHDSCVKEIATCDMVILIIGSRFGGTAVPSTLLNLDLEVLRKLSTKAGVIEFKEKLSITQFEVLKAVEQQIPVYAFVDERVLHDHQVYERNKDKKEVIDNIEFPSIQKRDTAKYVFEFINFLSHRITNNSIVPFTRLDDIRAHLAAQWSQLFQRLLIESRTRAHDERRYRDFSERIEDLKALVLASLATPDLRETAKGALQFRRLIGFVSAFRFINHRDVLLSDRTWEQVMQAAHVVEIRSDGDRMGREALLILEDRTFYKCRYPSRVLEDLGIDWGFFLNLETPAREAIVDALLEDRDRRFMPIISYVRENIDDYLADRRRAPSPDTEAEGPTSAVPAVQEGAPPVNAGA